MRHPRGFLSLLGIAGVLAIMAIPTAASAQSYCWNCDSVIGCYAQNYTSGREDCEVLYVEIMKQLLPSMCVTDGDTCTNSGWTTAFNDQPVYEDYLERIRDAVKYAGTCQRREAGEASIAASHRNGAEWLTSG